MTKLEDLANRLNNAYANERVAAVDVREAEIEFEAIKKIYLEAHRDRLMAQGDLTVEICRVEKYVPREDK